MKSAGNCIEPTPKNLECHNSPRQTIRCTRPRTAVKCKLFPSKVSGDRKSVEISLVSVLWVGRHAENSGTRVLLPRMLSDRLPLRRNVCTQCRRRFLFCGK